MEFECNKCYKLFSDRSKLNRHLINVCGDKSKNYPCNLCAKIFTSELKLKRHVVDYHIDKMKELGSDTHILSKIEQTTQVKFRKTAMKCPEEGCTDAGFPSLKRFRKHLMEIHGKEMTKSTHQFSSIEEFNYWKDRVEKEIGIRYSGLSGRKKDGPKIMQTYYCRRSGVPRVRGTGKKKPKSQGSCKIGYYCSSTIELCIMDGIYYVTFYEEHSGHDLDVPSLAHTTLPKSDKRFIAGLLCKNYSQEDILQMARDEFQGRLSLIKPHDIKNIAKSFKLDIDSFEYFDENIYRGVNDSSIKSGESSADESMIHDTADLLADEDSFDDDEDEYYATKHIKGKLHERLYENTLITDTYNTSNLTAQEVVDLAANLIDEQIKSTISGTLQTTEYDDIENSPATIPKLLIRFLSGLVKSKHHQIKIANSITEAAQHRNESKFVPGRVAVCAPCGILSVDLDFCQKCKTPFANISQQHPESSDKADMSCTIEILGDDFTTFETGNIDANNGMIFKMEDNYDINPSEGKKFRFDTSFDKPKANKITQRKSLRPISQLEPVITADMDDHEDIEEQTTSINMKTEVEPTLQTIGSSIPDFESLAQRNLQGKYKPYKYIPCRNLRIGSYNVIPTEDVYLVPEGITLKIPPVGHNENEIVTIKIPIKKIVKILGHFHGNPPVLFLYLTPSMGSAICDALKMTDQSECFYDPCSLDESQRRITILPKTRIDRAIFDEIIHIGNSNLTDVSQGLSSEMPHCTLEELNQQEANEILVLSS